MEIIKQTASELVLKDKPDASLVWALGLTGIPLIIVIFYTFYELGVTTLKCLRVEPTQVSCEKQQSKFFGFIQQPPTRFSQVTSAKFKSKEEFYLDGDRTIDNWVTLVTNTGEVTFVKDRVSYNGVRGSADEMQAIATQINNFIQSNQDVLKIQRDLRWNFLGQNLLPLGLWSIFVIILGNTLFINYRSETLIFDKNSGYLIRSQKTLLDKKDESYQLYEIIGINIEATTDSDGDTLYELYELRLLRGSIYKRKLTSSFKLVHVENIQKTIRDFLKLS